MTRRERVRRLVDGELDAEQHAALLSEAERDPELAGLTEQERQLRGGLAALRAQTPPVPADLADRCVQHALEHGGDIRVRRRRGARRRALAVGTPLALAAAAMLVWGLGGASRGPSTGDEPFATRPASDGDRGSTGARASDAQQAEAAPRPDDGSEPDTVAVRFELEAPEASSVSLAGDFNGWDPELLPRDEDGDGIFATTLRLTRGSYAYMFVVDGERWVADPKAGTYRDDGFGNRNAVLRIN